MVYKIVDIIESVYSTTRGGIKEKKKDLVLLTVSYTHLDVYKRQCMYIYNFSAVYTFLYVKIIVLFHDV